MPRVIQGCDIAVVELNIELRQDDSKRLEMEYIEPGERSTARPNLFHRRLIQAAPAVGECMTGDVGTTHGFDLAGHAGAPIDHCAEHIEQKRLQRSLFFFFFFSSLECPPADSSAPASGMRRKKSHF